MGWATANNQHYCLFISLVYLDRGGSLVIRSFFTVMRDYTASVPSSWRRVTTPVRRASSRASRYQQAMELCI